jgi:hypothetical protein
MRRRFPRLRRPRSPRRARARRHRPRSSPPTAAGRRRGDVEVVLGHHQHTAADRPGIDEPAVERGPFADGGPSWIRLVDHGDVHARLHPPVPATADDGAPGRVAEGTPRRLLGDDREPRAVQEQIPLVAGGGDVADDREALRWPRIDDVDAVAGEHEQVLAVGLDAVALVDAGNLVVRARKITGLRRARRGRRGQGDHPVAQRHVAPPPGPRGLRAELVTPAGHRRLDVPRLELVGIGGQPQRVGALVADQRFAGIGRDDLVSILRAVQGVDARPTIESVAAVAAAERVAAGVTVEAVVARCADERVVVRAAADEVVAGATVDRVVIGATEDFVVDSAAEDRVFAPTASDLVVLISRRDDVVTGVAEQLRPQPRVARHVHGDRVVPGPAEHPHDPDEGLGPPADDHVVDRRPQHAGPAGIPVDEDRVGGLSRTILARDRPGEPRDGQRPPRLETFDVGQFRFCRGPPDAARGNDGGWQPWRRPSGSFPTGAKHPENAQKNR